MQITKPTLVIDKQKVQANINRMLKKTENTSVVFRPHFKTHQLAEIGELYKKSGVVSITVSSVSMAKYFANQGWTDITIAFPLNILELDEINRIAKDIRINLLVESTITTSKLLDRISYPVGIFIKIDTGYNRTGLEINDAEIDRIIVLIKGNKNCSFKGFLSHAGHTYSIRGKNDILQIMEFSKITLNELKQKYISDFPDIIVSYGDTPSCSMADGFDGFDEIRPGNFVYYDIMQYHIGSCTLDDIAVVVACPVVATHSSRNEIIIYGGGVHLSKEFISADNNFKLFGYVVKMTKTGWSEPIPGTYVSSLSQEHGIIKTTDSGLKTINPGDVIGIIPIHSCLAANLLKDSFQII